MSCVADAKAVIQNSTRVIENSDTWVLPAAITSGLGFGRVSAVNAKATDMSTCIRITHQRFVRIMSTKGLQRGLITHGRYSKLVYIAMSPLDIPIFVNMMTDILFTIKYGIPSAKYNVGIQLQGDLNCRIRIIMFQNLFVIIASGGHYSGTNLTEAYTMSPSTTIKPYLVLIGITDLKS